jgi:carbon-monoxide dehydrogenase medium subunit
VRPGKERTVTAADFFLEAFTTALEPGEMVYEVIVPADAPGVGSAYVKFQQPASGFAVVGVAAQVAVSGGKISTARVGLTGVAGKSYVATAVEQALTGRPAGAIAEAARLATQGVEPLNDLYAQADYRAHLAQVATRRALEQALARAR